MYRPSEYCSIKDAYSDIQRDEAQRHHNTQRMISEMSNDDILKSEISELSEISDIDSYGKSKRNKPILNSKASQFDTANDFFKSTSDIGDEDSISSLKSENMFADDAMSDSDVFGKKKSKSKKDFLLDHHESRVPFFNHDSIRQKSQNFEHITTSLHNKHTSKCNLENHIKKCKKCRDYVLNFVSKNDSINKLIKRDVHETIPKEFDEHSCSETFDYQPTVGYEHFGTNQTIHFDFSIDDVITYVIFIILACLIFKITTKMLGKIFG